MPDYDSVTVGWFLGDELIQSGIPVANLTAVARQIKQQWGLSSSGSRGLPRTVMVYTNEDGSCFTTAAGTIPKPGEACAANLRCAAAGPAGSDARNRGCCMDRNNGGLPAELDAISIDMYSPSEGCGTGSIWAGSGPCNASANLYYCPDPTKEADCLLKYYQAAIFPLMNDKQRAFFVPGLFGPVGGGAADAATDEILTQKFELYWQNALADPHIIGLNPWHYDQDKPLPKGVNAKWNALCEGAESYPKLMASMAEKSKTLPR